MVSSVRHTRNIKSIFPLALPNAVSLQFSRQLLLLLFLILDSPKCDPTREIHKRIVRTWIFFGAKFGGGNDAVLTEYFQAQPASPSSRWRNEGFGTATYETTWRLRGGFHCFWAGCDMGFAWLFAQAVINFIFLCMHIIFFSVSPYNF